MSTEAIRRLELFVEKVEYLRSLSLVRTLVQGGSTMQVSWTAESQALQLALTGPNAEQIDAFLLTMRLFMQDNDRISIRNMAAFVDELPVTDELKSLFAMHRNNLNKHLDSGSMLALDDQHLTHRTILETVLYGQLAHVDQRHRERYLAWQRTPLMEGMISFEFIGILSFFLRTLVVLAAICRDAAAELRGTKPDTGNVTRSSPGPEPGGEAGELTGEAGALEAS